MDGEHVREAAFDPESGALTVEVTDEEAASRVEAFVAGMGRTHRLIGRKVLRSTRAERLAEGFSDSELARSPDVRLIGEGLTGLSGNLLRLFRFFERRFAALAAQYGAEDQHYPVMIPAALLAEMGYFGHFPQHVTFCCHFPDSLPLLESVAAEAGGAGADPEALGRSFGPRLAPPGHVLAPGVCLPCYAGQRDVVLEPGEVRVLTMQNHVFRYEAGNFRPLARGWDFTVRDIVLFGSGEDLTRLRSELMEQVHHLCLELDLSTTLELANDPFFLDASRDKAVYQRMGEVKYELLFELPHRDAPLAASSFNLHRDFYTSLYNIRRSDGGLAESACMGFGLERWLYGFISQKGLDPAGWPPAVAEALGAVPAQPSSS
jgi:seryl-tRNA synthetase